MTKVIVDGKTFESNNLILIADKNDGTYARVIEVTGNLSKLMAVKEAVDDISAVLKDTCIKNIEKTINKAVSAGAFNCAIELSELLKEVKK